MIVRLRNISKSYKQGGYPVPALRDISLDIEEGEYLAIMGPSGSGKSTLMNILGCLDLPASGQYDFNGRDISSRGEKELARTRSLDIGFVFQAPNLMQEYDALDNVALPLLYSGMKKASRREIAGEALRRVGLEDRMKSRPDRLSGGQQQRVAVARAIVRKPKLLLADEPTGALDSVSGDVLMDIFDELHRGGATIVVVTHERAVAERSHRILYLRGGEISGGTRRRTGQ